MVFFSNEKMNNKTTSGFFVVEKLQFGCRIDFYQKLCSTGYSVWLILTLTRDFSSLSLRLRHQRDCINWQTFSCPRDVTSNRLKVMIFDWQTRTTWQKGCLENAKCHSLLSIKETMGVTKQEVWSTNSRKNILFRHKTDQNNVTSFQDKTTSLFR